MEDAGHCSTVEAALNFEKQNRTLVNNFALGTSSRNTEILVKDSRLNPKMYVKIPVDYAMMIRSDFVKPILDSQMVCQYGMTVKFPNDDYGSVKSSLIETAEDSSELTSFDPNAAKECPNFDKCKYRR